MLTFHETCPLLWCQCHIKVPIRIVLQRLHPWFYFLVWTTKNSNSWAKNIQLIILGSRKAKEHNEEMLSHFKLPDQGRSLREKGKANATVILESVWYLRDHPPCFLPGMHNQNNSNFIDEEFLTCNGGIKENWSTQIGDAKSLQTALTRDTTETAMQYQCDIEDPI